MNALFGKLTNSNGGIPAQKLWKLLHSTDCNIHKLEYYKSKLITDADPNRLISRGPFIAIFKHEAIAFVNNLENAARPLRNKKRRKKGTKSIQSAPVRMLKQQQPQEETFKQSPKRTKIEDKTGMIIVAKVDPDEISTVSGISPTNASTTSEGSDTMTLIDGDYKPVEATRKKVRRSAKKSKKKKKRLRNIKSVGSYNADTQEDDAGSVATRSTFTDATKSTSRGLNDHDQSTVTNTSVSKDYQPSPKNDRFDMNQMFYPPQQPNMSVPHPYDAQGSMNMYGMPHPMLPNFSIGYPPIYSHHPHHYMHNAMNYNGHAQQSHVPSAFLHWQQGQTTSRNNEYMDPYYSSSKEDKIDYEECFLIKGITAFFKSIFGKKTTLLDQSPIRQGEQAQVNPVVLPPRQPEQVNAWPMHHDQHQSRARIVSDDSSYTASTYEYGSTTNESAFSSLHTEVQFVNDRNDDAEIRCNLFSDESEDMWGMKLKASNTSSTLESVDENSFSVYTETTKSTEGTKEKNSTRVPLRPRLSSKNRIRTINFRESSEESDKRLKSSRPKSLRSAGRSKSEGVRKSYRLKTLSVNTTGKSGSSSSSGKASDSSISGNRKRTKSSPHVRSMKSSSLSKPSLVSRSVSLGTASLSSRNGRMSTPSGVRDGFFHYR